MQFRLDTTETEVITSTTTTTTTVAVLTQGHLQISTNPSAYYNWDAGLLTGRLTETAETKWAFPLGGGQVYMVDQPERKLWAVRIAKTTADRVQIAVMTDEEASSGLGNTPLICKTDEDGRVICDDPREGWSQYRACGTSLFVFMSTVEGTPSGCQIVQWTVPLETETELATSTTTTTTTVAPTPTPV